jgi:DDE family transposase
MGNKVSDEETIRDIKRKTRRKYKLEEKIRIVLGILFPDLDQGNCIWKGWKDNGRKKRGDSMLTHPNSISEHFSGISDPRNEQNVWHPLINIMTIAICGSICGLITG